MKVCVFGAGAIGGYLGACLSRAGVDVSLVARGLHLEAIRSGGLRLQLDGKENVSHLRATDDPAELRLRLRHHRAQSAPDRRRCRRYTALLGPSTTIVTASNGLPYWYFQDDPALSGVDLDSIDREGSGSVLAPSAPSAVWCFPRPKSSRRASSAMKRDADSPSASRAARPARACESQQDDGCRRSGPEAP